MQALGMTDGFFTVLLIANCKAVRFLLDSKNCLLLSNFISRNSIKYTFLPRIAVSNVLGVHPRDAGKSASVLCDKLFEKPFLSH